MRENARVCIKVLDNRGWSVLMDVGISEKWKYREVCAIVTNLGGNYFSTHYHLGSKKFETAEEEQFLYGDMTDINYLVPPPSAVCYFFHFIEVTIPIIVMRNSSEFDSNAIFQLITFVLVLSIC